MRCVFRKNGCPNAVGVPKKGKKIPGLLWPNYFLQITFI
jgi:hypothetical protein